MLPFALACMIPATKPPRETPKHKRPLTDLMGIGHATENSSTTKTPVTSGPTASLTMVGGGSGRTPYAGVHRRRKRWRLSRLDSSNKQADTAFSKLFLDQGRYPRPEKLSQSVELPKAYFVYVIALNPRVLGRTTFRRKNPGYRTGQPCVYVGSSVRPPDLRFDQHKQGYKSNRYAREYGERLLPEAFEQYNPIPNRKEAEELEVYLADRLRRKGWAVWQG